MNAQKTGTVEVAALLLALLLALALALALIVLSLGASANRAEAATAVTKTFAHTTQTIIPTGCAVGGTKGGAEPYPSSTFAYGFRKGTRILDVNLTLQNYNHTFPDDVDVLLVHGTRSRTVMSDVGGSTDVNNTTLTLDDEAGLNKFLPNDGPLVSGTFKPTNVNFTATDTFPPSAPAGFSPSPELSGFDGQKANGRWDLFVVDDSLADCGKIGLWSITIRAR